MTESETLDVRRTSRTTSSYLRNVVQSMRSRWREREMKNAPVNVPSAFVFFPVVSDDTLQTLFCDQAHPTFPKCVRAALQFMEEGYKDDKKYPEDVRRGFWALAQLVNHVHSDAPNQNTGRPTNEQEEISEDAANSPRASVSSLISKGNHTFEMHDLFAAIDKNDIDKIMAIRESHFDLLLGSSDEPGTGARTPLDYAISFGPSHERSCLFLVGAFSRYVNHLPDDKPLTQMEKDTLRKVRSNLKLAMDHSLYTGDTSLVASYLQVLVMSEGFGWQEHAIKSVRYELEAWLNNRLHVGGIVPQPLSVAHDAIESFLTSHMRLRRQSERAIVAAVDDYIANASGDLVLLALWSLLPTHDKLPLYAFARDDRCTVLFCEEVGRQVDASSKASRTAERIVDALYEGVRSHSAAERWGILQRIIK